jgi:hypothetical protein
MPSFTRSTGVNEPGLRLAVSSQADAAFGPDCIEPDKGAVAGVALLRLFEATKDTRFRDQAIHNAKLLAKHQRPGQADSAPWPFRVDSIVGVGFDYKKNANTAFPLELYDVLIEQYNMTQFTQPRDALKKWILTVQIPSGDSPAESQWVNFFEDKIELKELNRNSWGPLTMARYLVERRERTDPNWRENAGRLIAFALKYFGRPSIGNVTMMTEQDQDHKPWGGACSNLVSVAAKYACAPGGGPHYFKQLASLLMNHMTYFVREDGCPAPDNEGSSSSCGGWQEDAFFDKIHNWVDAIEALEKCG